MTGRRDGEGKGVDCWGQGNDSDARWGWVRVLGSERVAQGSADGVDVDHDALSI